MDINKIIGIDHIVSGLPSYEHFLASKMQIEYNDGFDTLWIPEFLFDFQKYLVEFSIKKGRSAIIADCGMGKTPIELICAQNVVMKTNKPILIYTPLAVAEQFVNEGEKFGIDVYRSSDGKWPHDKKIIVTNYERNHYFNQVDFQNSMVICDEASALKAFDGKRRKQITRFVSKIPYRLCATATAAPNDYVETGVISEVLGVLTQDEVIEKFFMTSDKQRHSLFKDGDFWTRRKHFFKPHSEIEFWRFVTAWARACRKPSDLDPLFDDEPFILPELIMRQQIVECSIPLNGKLFVEPARTLAEQREERKLTIKERCEKVAELVDHNEPAVVWCQYNNEGELLEEMIKDGVEVAGRHNDNVKEDRLSDFTKGNIRVLITKPKIGAWGLNWQHVGHHIFFPSHSFEQWYQAIRRSLRFGRKGPVICDVVATPGEDGILDNMKMKSEQADHMFESLVSEMNNSLNNIKIRKYEKKARLPKWIN